MYLSDVKKIKFINKNLDNLFVIGYNIFTDSNICRVKTR